jgi:hypothetical protein
LIKLALKLRGIKTPPVPPNLPRFSYQIIYTEYHKQGYYINYYEVCYDDCTGDQTSKTLLDIKDKSNKVETVINDRWAETKYL